ncbi:hypothetical protein AVEN_54470-1 [Araneus ventricosus]|uniref:Uncharacterized protein n=1 Tax=Araneus ventricosus TaxID=182803 RepID=A0A4Y2HM07_ARAVE|nr:hypothetical protein AVEN_54470-1 [Araneus ventricosus]
MSLPPDDMFRWPKGNSPTRRASNASADPSGDMFGGLLRREEMTRGISPLDERRDIGNPSLHTTAHPMSIFNVAGDDSFLLDMFRRNVPMDGPRAKSPCRIQDLFYYSVFEKPDMWTGGVDAIVQRFLRGDLEWYLVFVRFAEFGAFVQEVVRFAEFGAFVQEMNEVREKMVALPFWCVRNDFEECQAHRIMMLACDESVDFQKVWTAQPGRTPCVRIRRVEHLKRIIKNVFDEINL